MSIDPRRSGPALWALWVVAAALGGALATVVSLSGLATVVNGSDSPAAVFAYFGAVAAIAAVFQSILLAFVAPGKRAVLLWLVATAIGASLFFTLLQNLVFRITLTSWFGSLPAGMAPALISIGNDAAYSLGLGLAQGLALVFITGRKWALAVWVAVSLIVQAYSSYLPPLYIGPSRAGTSYIASNAINLAVGAAFTGVALVLI
ncbi:MAG TPA: hypothetical protein VFR33_11445, partial [Candidatus Dormibacteraeota bacterium]|nr:hypothetical protein [Candidatus Dormibacteraeota bacterium]